MENENIGDEDMMDIYSDDEPEETLLNEQSDLHLQPALPAILSQSPPTKSELEILHN